MKSDRIVTLHQTVVLLKHKAEALLKLAEGLDANGKKRLLNTKEQKMIRESYLEMVEETMEMAKVNYITGNREHFGEDVRRLKQLEREISEL